MAITKRNDKGSALTYDEMDDNFDAIAPRTSATGAVEIPAGTTADRPTPTAGMFRYNTSLNSFEGYSSGAWGAVGSGGVGGGDPNQNAWSEFIVAGQTNVSADNVTDSVTLIAGTNMSITTDAAADSITFNASFNQDFAYTSLTGAPTIPSALTDLGISDGSTGQVLSTDGGGNFTFVNQTGGGLQGVQGTDGIQGPLGTTLQGVQGIRGPDGIDGQDGQPGDPGIQGPAGSVQGLQGSTGSGTQGVQGFSGFQGTIGAQGAGGPEGTPGDEGPQGTTGSGAQGAQGTTGFQGTVGLGGQPGFQGMQGIQGGGGQGVQGVTGPAGFGNQGIQGVQGDTGSDGPPGQTGAQGLQGTTGAGIQGPEGNDGPPGLQGSDGSGAQGLQGLQGAAGIGETGAQGANGINGAQGTIGETGPQGVTGIQGSEIQGAQGVQGPTLQGIQGQAGSVQGLQGTEGNGAQGIQGVQGLALQGSDGGAGDEGPQGVQGIQGVGAQGVQGLALQGIQGDAGIQGNAVQGVQGLLGFQGTQGPQSIQGTDGIQGIQGNIGSTGVGSPGAQGTDGTQGVQGIQGIFGLQGSTGSGNQGVQGLQCPVGLVNLADDTTPQLGGNLDVNGFDITSASDGTIGIKPNGIGDVFFQTTKTGSTTAGMVGFRKDLPNNVETHELGSHALYAYTNSTTSGIWASIALHPGTDTGPSTTPFNYIRATRKSNYTADFKISNSGLSNRWDTIFYGDDQDGNVKFPGTVQLKSLSDTARDALTVNSAGMLIWNSDNSRVQFHDGANWKEVPDEYVEGTWTPIIRGTSSAGSATYSVQTGTYTKVGRVVTFNFAVVWTGHTGTGTIEIGGFPFNAGTETYYLVQTLDVGLTSGSIAHCARIDAADNYGQLIQTPTASSGRNTVNMDSSGDIRGSGTFQTA